MSYETPSFYVFFVFKKGVTALPVVSGMVVFFIENNGGNKKTPSFFRERV